MPEYSDAGNLRKYFPEKSQTFGNQFRAGEGRPRDVSSWPRQAGHESVSDRIAHSTYDDRRRGEHLLCSKAGGRSPREDEVELETRQFGSQSQEPFNLPICCPVLDEDILTLNIAKFVKCFTEGLQAFPPLGRFEGADYQITYPCDFRRLLRARRERPRGRCAAESQDELAPLHSITSSARA